MSVPIPDRDPGAVRHIQKIEFDADLIRRYDIAGPRYTSYPTVLQFNEAFGEARYLRNAQLSNADPVPRPLSLYFHIPFCNTVCYYCACSKVVTKYRDRAAPYLARLHREIELQAGVFDPDRQVDQLHWGGGTPTFIGHRPMRELMAVIRRHFRLRDDDQGEYALEIDPREADADTIALLRELGFNRLSMGVQDLDPSAGRREPDSARRSGPGSAVCRAPPWFPVGERRFDLRLASSDRVPLR